nr:purine/pyrimidine permease [Pseudomonas sp.]
MTLRAALSHIRLPASPSARRRSPELIYSAAQLPPGGQLLTLGLQHAAAALTLITYVIAAATIARLPTAQTQAMVAATALGMAMCTALQAWGGRLGSGIMLVHIPNPLLVTLVAAVVTRYGPGGLVATALLSGLCALAVSQLLPRLRTLFPPTVAGVVICISGLTLSASALTHAFGLNPESGVDRADVLISSLTLAVVVACSIWGSRALKLLGLLFGLAVGIGAAAMLGKLGAFDGISQSAWFALPALHMPVFAIDPGLALAVALIAVLTQLDTLGTAVLMQKMEDADWRRADLKSVAGAIRANALGDIMCSALSPYPTATSSANVALCHISRSTSRYVGLMAAGLLALVALMPKATLALTLIPIPVIGAIELYVAAYLVVGGIELIAQRALDSRGIFMVGLSLTSGLGVVLLPAIAGHAPAALQFMMGNGMVVAGLLAIGLNLLFRLGTSRQASLLLAEAATSPATTITDFVDMQGAAWGARRDVIARAALAALEATEAIDAAGDGRRVTALSGSFDEYNLNIDLLHQGPPFPLASPPQAADLARLLDDDDDDALDQAMANVSVVLLRNLADRITTGTREQQSFLRLHFDH